MSSDRGGEEWVVDAADEGERLDRFLAERLPDRSRSRLQALVREGRVSVDGEVRKKPGAPLAAGERVRAELPELDPRPDAARARQELVVLHEDEQLLVVDKPAGLLSHRTEGGAEITLAELAEARSGPLPSSQGEGRPGIVHRLDRDTSGVMVLARTPEAMEALLRQFREREVEKTYEALVAGEPRFHSDWIDEPLGRHPRQPDRVCVLPEEEGGRPASTYYEVLERLPGGAHLLCRPRTGRTHQIRVHLVSVGLEVVGDRVHRVQGRRPALPEGAPRPRRQLLHARRLELTHPGTGERVAYEAPLPEDFTAQLEWLRAAAEPS
jgi:23S rRNA pseudouridine1911/1915/1917 synthase